MEIVNAGYMTISFTDEDCREARNNFTARRDALVSAGAQILKTDFPTPPTHFASSYVVSFTECCFFVIPITVSHCHVHCRFYQRVC